MKAFIKFIKLIIGVLIIAAIYFGIDTFRTQQEITPSPEIVRPVRTIRLAGENDSFTRHYFGTVQGGRRADLSFKVSGTLSSINVDKGSPVKKGALIAALDTTDFNTALKQAQSSLAQAQAQYKNAVTDFKRYENLYRQRAVSRAQYDSAKTASDVAKSAVDMANAGVKSAKDALNYTKLTAPFTGIITDRKAEKSQNISAGQVIFNLADLSTLEIVFNIPDNDILSAPLPAYRNIHELIRDNGKLFTLKARFDALPDRVFDLNVKEIAAQPTASNTYPVTATMPSQNEIRILPGMAVTVEADLSERRAANENKFSVPVSAILNESGKTFIWKYLDGQASRHEVSAGEIHRDAFIDIRGDHLKAGDIIITAGVNSLHEGQNVRLMED